MWATFATKGQKKLYMKFVCRVFLDFPIPTSQVKIITDLDLITEFDLLPIVQGFHGTYATGAACQQRTLTPPDTWSCPTLGLACVLMSRPISPELVLSPDF